MMFSTGTGVSKDDKRAAGWLTVAAEQRNAHTQFHLGVMYTSGYGVIKDNVHAHMWGNIAASNGNENGRKLRDFVAKEMAPADISTAQDLARECVRKKYKGC